MFSFWVSLTQKMTILTRKMTPTTGRQRVTPVWRRGLAIWTLSVAYGELARKRIVYILIKAKKKKITS